MEISENKKYEKYLYIGVVIPVALGLYFSSRYSYLLFHSLIEITTISIGFTIFILTWNARKFLVNNYLKILGIGYAFIAFIDLVHTLAYKGMVIFPGYGTNLPTQLWISARYLQTATLCAALLFMKRRVSIRVIFAVYTASVVTLVAMIFHGNFPDCFIDNKGLTDFKIISEYVITAFLLVSLYFLYRKRKYFVDRVFFLIVFSIICTVFSEISFTLFIDLYGFANMIGHFFKLAAFSLIYRAILITGLKEPYDLIFRDFKLAEESLKKAYDSLEEKVRERTAELSASEQLFRSYIENAPDGVFIVDETGHYIAVNRSACRITGYSDVEIKQMYIRDLLSEESLEDGLVHFKKIINTGAAVSDLWHKNKDGSKQCLTINAVKLSETRILGFAKDITKRKQMEEALRNSETRLKEAQRITRIGNWELDIINNVLLWSDEIYRIFDIDPAKFTASYEAFLDAIYPDDRDMVNNAYTESLKNRLPYEIEHRLLLKDGSIKYVNEKCVTYYGEDGSPLRSVGTVQDITERKKTEEKLTLLNYALDHVKESVFLIGEDMRFHYVNEESCRILGYSREELLGLCVAQIDPEFPIERWPDHWKDLQSNASLSFESSHKTKDGCIFPVEVNANYFKFNGVGFNLALVRDITERRRIEIELIESEARYRNNSNLLASILESSSAVGIYALDLEYRFISFNQTYLETAKRLWDVDILIGMSSLDAINTGEHRQLKRQAFDQVFAGRNLTFESREAVVDDGFQEYEYHDNYGSPIFNDRGEVVGLTIFIINITEQKRASDIIRQLNINLSTTLQTIPDPLFELDGNGLCINAWAQNPKIRAVQKEFLISRTVAEILAPEYAEILMASIREADEKGCSYGKIICFDYQGNLLWFELSVAKKAHIDGSDSLFIVLSRDITERKSAEIALSESELRYQSVFNNFTDGLHLLEKADDGHFRIIEANQALERITGIPRTLSIGRTVEELLDKKLANEFTEKCRQCVESGHIMEYEKTFYLPIGERYFAVKLIPINDNTGFIKRVLTITLDLTERRKLEKDVAARDQEYRSLAENLPYIFIRYDLDCRVVFGETKDVHSLHDLELIHLGKTPLECFPDGLYDGGMAEMENYQSTLHQVIATGVEKEVEMHIFDNTGLKRTHKVLFSPNRDAEGKITGALAFGRDITEQKETENLLTLQGYALDHIREGAFLIGEGGRLFYVNDEACRSLKYTREELLNMTVYDIDLWMKREQIVDQSGKITAFSIESRHKAKDGRSFPVEVSSSPLYLNDRVYNMALVRDISERKQVNDALKESESRYREIFENSSDLIFLLEVTEDGRFRNLDQNRAFENSTGLSRHQLRGKFIEETVSDETTQVVNNQYHRCADTGEVVEEDIEFFLPVGKRVYHSTIVPLRDNSGRIYRLLGISRDITERKHMEKSLQESEEKFRTLFEQSADPQLILKDGVFIDFNQAAITFLGYNSKDELFGLKPHEISPELQPDGTLSSEKSYDIINQALIHGSKNFEWVHKKKNGDDVVVDITITAIPLKDEIIFYVIFKDITEKKYLEKEILEISIREQQKIGRSLHDDLGQVLTGIGFLSESLIKKMVKLSFPEMDKIERINNLIQKAKDRTRALARGLFTVDISSYGLTAAISRLVDDYELIYQVFFSFIYDSYIKLENIVEIQLYYIIQESIINAINHGKAKNIKINLSCEKNKLNLIIQDDGVGISANFEKVKGMGIRIMIYRSKAIGAEFKISNVRKGGTKVILSKQIKTA